jgi:hypothetical protein
MTVVHPISGQEDLGFLQAMFRRQRLHVAGKTDSFPPGWPFDKERNPGPLIKGNG